MVNWDRDIAKDLVTAWQKLTSAHTHLFLENAGEPVISSAFAPFLDSICPVDFVVNNEYDRMNSYFKIRIEKELSFGGDPEEIKPDIVIHKPNDDSIAGNLLAIEIKKWTNGDWRHDEDKLIQMTSSPVAPQSFQYRFGLLIRFRKNGEIGFASMFEGGKQKVLGRKTFLLQCGDRE